MNILKQSTAVDVLIGPFVDRTDGFTAEVGEAPVVKLSKNGAALDGKTEVTVPTHTADGYYICKLDATDSNTVGTITLTVAASATALPVRHAFQVVEEAVYDALFAAGAAGYGTAQTGDSFARLGEPAGASVSADVAAVKAETALIVEDTAVIGALGAGLTAIPWNAAWDAEVQSEVQDAIEVNHLDHLLAADYDPAAKPGVATALLNELVENDAGVSRFTENALEQAPSAASIADAVWDETLADHLAAGSTGAGLNAAGSAGDPWETTLPGTYGDNTAGKIIGDNLDAKVSTRSTLAAGAAMTLTEAYDKAKDDVLTPLGIVDGKVDAIKTETDKIDTLTEDVTGLRFTEKALEQAPSGGGDTVWNTAQRDTVLGYDTKIDDIKTETDKLDFTGAAGMLKSESTNATTPPTVEQIRQEIDTNSTQLAALVKIGNADIKLNMTSTPWQEEYYESGTATPLFVKKLYDSAGAAVASIDTYAAYKQENALV